jgi:hypothetical protein
MQDQIRHAATNPVKLGQPGNAQLNRPREWTQRRDPAHERTWIALVDGNKQQIEAIAAEAAARGVTVTTLIDFIHVLEYAFI